MTKVKVVFEIEVLRLYDSKNNDVSPSVWWGSDLWELCKWFKS